jgi:hypothetical protein
MRWIAIADAKKIIHQVRIEKHAFSYWGCYQSTFPGLLDHRTIGTSIAGEPDPACIFTK